MQDDNRPALEDARCRLPDFRQHTAFGASRLVAQHMLQSTRIGTRRGWRLEENDDDFKNRY